MGKQSAGILLFRKNKDGLQVMLAHPGGPFWAKKDAGAWSIPKGEFDDGEDILHAAQREFKEETGVELKGNFIPLQAVKQKNGKLVHAFALEGDMDVTTIASNTFTIEWPPHSGTMKEFPEIDRCSWFSVDEAKEKINPAQAALVDELALMMDR
ncbi:NUDIX domain-containing protein [Foetidibacter luteolus]|uniref:NUDIX domain-containing protein n=1 Tax=Foetidibacter luteolus TaxID=2608880 RepID=UPI00129AD2F6|nr:NUDIX domain-containing protein [Foetidibacter luteolus]